MKKLILATSLMIMPFMAQAMSIEEYKMHSSKSPKEQEQYFKSMTPEEQEQFIDEYYEAQARAIILEERKRSGITDDMVRSICNTWKSIIVEAAQYRDEGYPLHRVSNHASSQAYYADMDEMVLATRKHVREMFQTPDVPPETIGENALNECMGYE